MTLRNRIAKLEQFTGSDDERRPLIVQPIEGNDPTHGTTPYGEEWQRMAAESLEACIDRIAMTGSPRGTV